MPLFQRHHLLHSCLYLWIRLHSSSRSLRFSADTRLLEIPLYRCKTKGDRAFSYSGPSVSNSLPLHIRNATTIDIFKSALKMYLFNLKESDYLISAWFALCKCVWCVVCVCGLRRERECRQRTWLCVDVLMYDYVESEKNICVIILLPRPPSSFMIL